MTKNGSRTVTVLAAIAFGAALAAPAHSEELRIGFIAPMTGIFAQIGKDMVNGFQLYLDEHGGKLGGADVKLLVEDSAGKPDTARHQSQEAGAARQGADVHGRTAGLDRLRFGAGQHQRKDALHLAHFGGRRSDPTPAREISVFHPHRLDLVAAARMPSASGPATKATKKSSPSPPTMPSAMSRSAASRRRSRTAAARSSRKSGRRSAPRISGPSSQASRPTPTPSSR